ncbi:actin filament-associated protein 1 [Etheostoma spectabile]|uniref:actin filament-associated protein 1 n=1 Tax=Etheostoma spectabile TaxID=54343 RepID=UPI0013AF2399|nr:actin filament-associated protein 1-like [Etheostoma spectabile]
MTCTPPTGKAGRTPMVTSPCTKSEKSVNLCCGAEKTVKPIPRTAILEPVAVSEEKDSTESTINESRISVPDTDNEGFVCSHTAARTRLRSSRKDAAAADDFVGEYTGLSFFLNTGHSLSSDPSPYNSYRHDVGPASPGTPVYLSPLNPFRLPDRFGLPKMNILTEVCVHVVSLQSSTVQTDSEEEKPSAGCSLNKDKGFLSVLMNCQWQSLLCQVEAGLLNMFGEEEKEEEVKRSPQYTVQLRGCEVRGGPDTDHSYRITLSMLGDQVAVLEVNSSSEKERWLKLLQDGAANHSHHDRNTQINTGGALSGLQTQRFPTSNTYMDDPFHLSGAGQDQPIYSNTSILELMLHSSQDSVQCSSVSSRDSVTYSNTAFTGHNRKSMEVERGIQKLELTGKRTVQRRAGSEINLASVGKQNKRTSFRQSLAICSERAQASFLNPLLRRTASAKNSLRRAPSALFIEHGKVFQRRKEWETKAAA